VASLLCVDSTAPVQSITTTALVVGLIILIAVALTLVLRYLVARVIRRIAKLPTRSIAVSSQGKVVIGEGSRTGQRLRTFQTVLNSTVTIVIWTVALLMILTELGVNVAPLLASAGVVGVALAFGAQSLVRDIISGIFMLFEDQYGVGDRVELGATGAIMASGTVERVALRITSIRDDDGRVWHIRNGEVMRVANESQGWSHAVVQIQVAPDTDITAARDAMTAVTAVLREDEGYRDAILADPDVRVEEVTGSGVTLRWSLRTRPGQQWRVASTMRRQITQELTERGIALAG
jgi:small-conductance mechanosensitive channel